MHTISVKLPESLDRALTALARRRGATRSALLREAIEVMTSAARPSVIDAAGDLVGGLRGPADLSTARKHMTGYGT